MAISQGVYHENIVINADLELFGETEKGHVVILSRHDTAVLVDRCSVKMVDIVMAVEEGALMHHALHIDHGEVNMDNCEMYGGLYGLFASDKSSVNALRCRFHAAYSFGASLLNSKGSFTDCYFFRCAFKPLTTCLAVPAHAILLDEQEQGGWIQYVRSFVPQYILPMSGVGESRIWNTRPHRSRGGN